MENKNWIGISITLLLIALGSIGYNITNQTYYCEERGLVMECARFSSSELRCYPSLITTKGYKDCSEGWVKVKGKIEPKIITNNHNQEDVKFICDNKGCNPISTLPL